MRGLIGGTGRNDVVGKAPGARKTAVVTRPTATKIESGRRYLGHKEAYFSAPTARAMRAQASSNDFVDVA